MTKGKASRVKREPFAPPAPTFESVADSPPPSETTAFTPQARLTGRAPSSSLAPSMHQRQPYRSDAPTPSERRAETVDDTEPVLLEMRTRGVNMAPENSMQSQEGLFDGSFRDFGDRVKFLNDTLAELQQLGVSHIISLPELVLVGDQSAGKSSLMSGLAGINLPRSEGVCTRCPIHIRVSRNQEWSCRVTLQQDYSFEPPTGGQITKADVTPRTPFPPWVKQQREIKDFKTIYDKSDIEDVLRWAQVAILNHNQNHELFIPGSGAIARNTDLATQAEATAAKFSPNTVALEIRGPDLPDLSFYDLPGIFRNSAREEDEYLVQVVENLAREYISHAGALIIWAVPMNADPETSSTLSIIRSLNATQRTIGVMTKADLLSSDGDYTRWLQMLRGQSHRIGHEYFITSRPTEKGLEDQARWEEGLFFQEGGLLWPQAFQQFRERSGVENLKASLSEKLGKEFAKSLPSIKMKAINRLEHVKNELRNLPELPSNVELEIRKSLMHFSATVKEKLRGKVFSSEYGKLSEAFRDCILHIKPKFTLKDPSDAPVLELADSDTDDASNHTPSNRKRGASAQNPNAKRHRPTVGGGSFASPGPNGMKNEEGNSSLPQTPMRPRPQPPALAEPFARYRTVGQRFRTLRQISEDIRAKTKAGMPNIVPDEVYDELCKKAVQPWYDPTLTFLHETMNLLHRIIDSALEQAFGTLKRRLIFKEAKAHMQSFLEQCKISTSNFLVEIYQMETFQLFTVNREAFEHYEKSELRLLTRYRHVMRWEAFSWEKADFPDWDKMMPQQRVEEEKRHAAETAKMGPDIFDKELKVAAYVRGYYKLAALRYADTVSLSITSRMFPNVMSKLDFYLDEKLELLGEGAFAMYQRLMEEDEATAGKRDQLKGEMDKFDKAMKSISELERQSGVVAMDPAASQQTSTHSESFDDDMDMDI